MAEIHIVKRKGHREKFDEKKVYGSCYFAARSCHHTEEKAEEIAQKALLELKKWLKEKKEVNSREIFGFLCQELKKIDKDTAFMYETHRDIS